LFIFLSGIPYATIDIGIWDCLSSQQVVDFVRLKISEGKELTEISEMICDHCLAPDTSRGLDKGTDNMTLIVVAILGGRTKEEWYSWITDRVKGNYGYQTPTAPPQIYAEARLRAFKERQKMYEELAAREEMERQAERADKQAPASEAQKSNVQESYEGTDRASTPDSDDSEGLPPKLSAVDINQ
jgi:hypothetical protein